MQLPGIFKNLQYFLMMSQKLEFGGRIIHRQDQYCHTTFVSYFINKESMEDFSSVEEEGFFLVGGWGRGGEGVAVFKVVK